MSKISDFMNEEELALADANEDQAEILLEAASLQLKRYKPFYGVLLSSMPLVKATETINTMATDGRNIYYSPEFVAGMTDERKKLVYQRIDKNIQDPKKNADMKHHIDVFYRKKTAREIAFVLEHECDHVVSDHMYRGKGFDFELFNIAADHRINTNAILIHSKADNMGRAWFPKGKDSDFPEDEEFAFMKWAYADFRFVDMFTEEIYEILRNEKQNPPPLGGSGGKKPGGSQGTDQHANSDGTFSNNPDEPTLSDVLGTNPAAKKPLSTEEKNRNDTVMRRAIQNGVKAAGAGAPKDARKYVEESGKPKINYLRLLRKTIERLFKDNVSYRRLHRRSYSLTKTLRNSGHLTSRQTIGLPSYSKAKTIRAHIFFDVSGSFNDSLLRPTMREIRGMCNQYDDFEVYLSCWSTKVGNTVKYTKANMRELSDYKITTTYGTDVSCVFEALDNEPQPADQIVIYTDGYFSDVSKVKDWAKKYGNKTLWVILGRHGNGWTPPFGKAVDFDQYL